MANAMGTNAMGTNAMKVLIDKGEIKLIKKGDDNYNMVVSIENPNINLNTIVNNNLIKLIHDLNPDLFEHIKIEKINDYESNIFILLKDLFNDMSLPQYYFYFNIKHFIEENHFLITTLESVNAFIKKRIEPVEIHYCRVNYTQLNDHQVQFSIDTVLTSGDNVVASMVEKITCNIIYKIFNRFKQFIYNITK